MKNILKQSYNKDAIHYEHKFKTHQYIKYKELLGEDASLLKSYNIVLDHGCGTGLLYNFLSERNALPTVFTGVDFSTGMLKIASTKHFPVIEAEITRLPFADNTFDAILSFTVIKIIENDDLLILDEVSRVLRKNGLCVISILANRLDRSFINQLLKTGFKINAKKNCGQDIGFICNKL